MERFKRTFSFRKKKSSVPESSKPHQWQEDEKKVRDGTCSFQVKVSNAFVVLYLQNCVSHKLKRFMKCRYT